MQYMYDTNEKDRKRITNKLNKMSDEEFKKTKNQDFRDTLANTHKYKDTSSATLTTPMSRLSQYNVQRGMRWMSNFTFERTLSRMDAKQGYDYLNRKHMDYDARLATYFRNGNIIY